MGSWRTSRSQILGRAGARGRACNRAVHHRIASSDPTPTRSRRLDRGGYATWKTWRSERNSINPARLNRGLGEISLRLVLATTRAEAPFASNSLPMDSTIRATRRPLTSTTLSMYLAGTLNVPSTLSYFGTNLSSSSITSPSLLRYATAYNKLHSPAQAASKHAYQMPPASSTSTMANT